MREEVEEDEKNALFPDEHRLLLRFNEQLYTTCRERTVKPKSMPASGLYLSIRDSGFLGQPRRKQGKDG